jgi:hypothetical protein
MTGQQLQQTHENARAQAKDIDKYAACSSTGDFEYARTEDAAETILDDMRAYHESQRPDLDHELDVIALDADPCDDCGDQEAERAVQCPVDEDRRLDLCADCYDERGPGIEVCHVRRDEDWDVNGGRASPRIEGAEKRHMGNTAFPAPGWIGNPHPMEEDSDVERWRVLKAFRRDLLEEVRDGEFFAYHLGKLRGKRVACWCRSESEDWPDGDGDPCHLDVVHAALMGLYREQ